VHGRSEVMPVDCGTADSFMAKHHQLQSCGL
jgi:ribosomal protein S27AE